MPDRDAIVIVIAEPALQQSLAFTLEAEGHQVMTFASWKAAEAFVPEALCVILDQDIVRKDTCAQKGLRGFAARTVLLDEHTASRDGASEIVLSKPLTGTDVIAAVDSFRARKNPDGEPWHK